MRFIAVFVFAAGLGALPAVAQTSCRITNAADGQTSIVSGDVTGTSVAMLVTENGPFSAKLTLDDGSAYTQAPGGSATLKVFRVGNSVTGKDWREPGSVETVDGGLLMSWPAFSLRGAPVRNLTVELSDQYGLTKTRQTISHAATHSGPTAIFLRLDGRLGAPSNSVLLETGYAGVTQWRAAMVRSVKLHVDLFDEDAGVHIGGIDFSGPAADAVQARLISDVTALRRAVAENTCQ